MDRKASCDFQDFHNMYMTSFLQELINAGFDIKAVPVIGKWIEVDR